MLPKLFPSLPFDFHRFASSKNSRKKASRSGLARLLAPGWLGLVGSIEEATSQNNQTKETRLFAALIAAPATLGMVMVGGVAFLVGWAIAIFALLT